MRRTQLLMLIGVTSVISLGSILPARAQQQQQALPVQQAPSASQNTSGAPATTTEQQRADLVRKRAEWFQKQRAYPSKHVPPGALQHAIEQRNSMIRQQRSGLGLAAPLLITFPGNGLWHLTGPQPTNIPSVPGPGNFGFPTVSGRVTALAVDTTDTTGNTVYLGAAAGGVWKTTDGGVNWKSLTDSQPSLAVGSIAVDPNSCSPVPCKTIYVGTGEENFASDSFYGAGILKSIDGGNTWTQMGASLFAGAQSPIGGAKIGAIAVQPGNPNIVLAAVTYFDSGTKGGIYRSADAGATWTQVSGSNAPIGAAGTEVIFEPTSVAGTTAIVYAAMGDPFGAASNGVYKSLDSGQTWTKLSGGLPGSNVGRIRLAYAPSTSGAGATLYATIANSAGSSADLLGFFVTTNGGTGWSQLTATPNFCGGQCFFDMAVAVHPTNPQFVVVGGSAFTDNSTTLFKTSNGGTTWSTDSTSPATDFTIGSTSVRPHVDTHALVFAPNGATPRLYVGDDGGTWRTDDTSPGNPLWVDLNATLAIAQFYPGATPSVSDENYGFGGTQDNDIQVFSGALDWTMAPACGDGGYTAIDTDTPTTIYAGCNETAAAKVRKSVFNGQFTPGPPPTPRPSFKAAETEITASGDTMGFIPPLVIDPNNSSDLYFGTCRIWQTTSSGDVINGLPAWNPMTTDLTNGNPIAPNASCADQDEITTIDVSQQSFGTLFAGTSNGKVWQTTFGFPTEIDNGLLPNRHITAVRSKRTDTTGNIAYVTFSGFGSCTGCGSTPGHVFKTSNATAGPSATWTDISGNLPDAPVNDIIVDHESNPTHDALYIATDVGVFSCPDPESGTPCKNWTVVGDGLPNAPVLSVGMRRESRILRAATHGRSMWDIQLTDEQPGPLPSLSSLTPAAMMAVQASAPATIISVTGVNFGPNTQATLFGGIIPTGMSTAFVSTTQLTVTLPSSLLQSGTVLDIGLTDPLGASASTLPFTVMNPIPDITGASANPGTGVVEEPVKFTLTGTGFVNGTQLILNGTQYTGTASNGGTTLTVTVPESALTAAMAGTSVPVTVSNLLPGGGPAAESFNIPVVANSGPEAVFNPSAIFFFPGIDPGGTGTLATNVQLSNSGTATLNLATKATITGPNATDFAFLAATGGSPSTPACADFTAVTTVTVAVGANCYFNMTFKPPLGTPPGSRTATLTVNDNSDDTPELIPITGIVNGPIPEFFTSIGNFCTGAGCFPSPVNFGSVPKGATSPVIDGTLVNVGSGNPALIVASISILSSTNSADFALVAPTNGTTACAAAPPTFSLAPFISCARGITFTPSTAGLETATLELTFSNSATAKIDVPLSGIGVIPTITTISPSIVPTGGPTFTMTVTGTNYVIGSAVNFSGSARLTTFVNATQLLASIPASDLTTAGSFAITVTNPSGGGTSEPKTLIVAQAPTGTNDDFKNATNTAATPLPFSATEDTTMFTRNTGGHADPVPACAPGGATLSGQARSAWFKFVATATGKVVANTRYSSYNTILSVWTGAPGSFVAVTCNNAGISGTTPESFVGFNVTNGTTYFLMVSDASGTGAGGVLTFGLDFAGAAPVNDPFSSAKVVAATPTAPYTDTVNTILATPNTGATDPTLPAPCVAAGAVNGGQGNSVWYSFTPGSTTPITADTLTSPYDTILSVWTGTPGAFTQIACNDNAGTGPSQVLQSQVSFTGTASTTYYFMVTSVLGDGGTTNFHLRLTAATSATLVSIAVTPANPSVAAGKTQQFTATGTFSDSSTQNITGTVTWASGTPANATINAIGLATAVKVGTSTISATNGSVVGSTTLTVTAATLSSIAVTPANPSVAAGKTQQFTATGTFSDSSTQNLTSSVTWSSGTPANATINAAGLATAVKVGTSTISATSGIVVGSTTLTVTAATLSSIAVTPANPSVAAGKTQQFTATGTFSDNSTQNLTGSVTWSSGTPANATINAAGLATAVKVGTSTISATSGSVVGSTTLAVTAATLSSIAVTPATPSIIVAATQQFTATGTFSDNSTQNLTGSVTWASGTTTVATINAAGLATAVKAGSSTISATSGSVVGSTTLTVTNATLVSIAVTPVNPSVAAGKTQQFTATGTFSDSSTQNLTGSVTWSSGTPANATISAAGLATAVKVGTSTISATSGSVVGSTTLTVTAATLSSIAVAPSNPSVAAGKTQQFTATGTFSDNSTQNLTGSVTWASGTTTNATINAAGLATAVKVGTSTISATSGSVVGSTTLTVTTATLSSIAVTPASPSIAAGKTQQFTATGTFSDNSTQNLTSSVTWSSSDTTIATINAAGLATGIKAGGPVTIKATSGSVNGTTSFILTAAVLTSIAITPANPSVAAGKTQQFTATGTFSDNSTQNLTGSVTWSSGTPANATINAAGLATAVKVGTSTISATSGSVVGSTTLTVTAATLSSIAVTPATPTIIVAGTQQFTATGTFSDNSTQDLMGSVTWASGTTTVATINAAGLATAVKAGSSTISATSGSVVGSTTLTVTNATLVSIAVTPVNPSVVAGKTQQFTATGTFSDSSTQNVTSTVTWSSSDTTVATINAAGLAAGVKLGGPVTIKAASGSVNGTTTLTVTAAVLSSIAVTPTNPSVPAGKTQQFTATGTFSDNSTQDLTSSVTWASGTTSVATINAAGLVTGVKAGSSTISATSGSVVGSTTLTVTAAVLTSIAVTPANPSIPAGKTQQFTAIGTFSDNSTQNLTSSVTWASGTTTIATINAAGLATTLKVGTSSISATSGSVVGSTTLTVTAAVLSSIAVTPPNPSILVAGTQQFTATGTFSDNSTQDLTSSATWASGTTAVATINAAGIATGVKAGTSIISATSGSVVGSTTLTVNAPPVVTTSPANQSVNAGGNATFTAAASGTPAPTVQWQVSVGGGAFSNVPNATSTTLTFTTTFSQNGNKYQAVFTNSVGTATTTAATLTVTAPDVTISKSHTGDFTVGSNGVYTIKVTNSGTGPTTGNVTVTDTVSAGLTFVSGSTAGGWSCTATGQAVTCTYSGPALTAAGGNSTVILTVSVAPGAFPSVTNTATVADPNDAKSNDKSATDAPTNIDNVVPTQSAFSPNLGLIAGATSAQQITITGTGFNSSTQVTLGSTAPLNTPLTGTANAAGTSLTISVPPAELALANAGNLAITAINPKNPTSNAGGGTATTTQSFPLVGMQSIAPQSGTPIPAQVVAGTPFALQMNLNLTPSGAALPADVTITCALPASLTGATCTPSPATIAHGTTSASSIITINAVPSTGVSARSTPQVPRIGWQGPWSSYSLWLIATVLFSMLGMLGAVRQRAAQFRRAPMYLTLALLILAAGALVGCTKASGPTPTSTGPSTITVTATTADGATVSATVNITISN